MDFHRGIAMPHGSITHSIISALWTGMHVAFPSSYSGAILVQKRYQSMEIIDTVDKTALRYETV